MAKLYTLGKVVMAACAAGMLAACASSRIPDLDFVKKPEFREDAENIGGYLNVAKAPLVPVDVRSAAEWDAAVSQLIAQRDGFIVPPLDTPLSDAEIDSQFTALKAEVHKYKLDDPIE